MRQLKPLASVCSALLLVGCVGSGEKYPSLAVRDAERVTGTFDPVSEPDEQPVTDPALLAGIPAIEARAQTAFDAFLAAVPGAEAAVLAAQGRPQASNQWATAQVALSELDSHRSQTAIALADVDLIYAEASSELALAPQIAEIRARIATQIASEDQILTELRRMIR